MPQPRLHALHVGKPKQHGTEGADDPMDRPWRSGIFKEPKKDPVFLGETNLDGDEQADKKNHGGPDKAVCVYPLAHLPYWAERLGRDDFGPGAFGENFTVAAMDEASVCVGDVYAVGEARVQVSQPRAPCWKLARRWGEKKLALWVQETGYTGWYLRVLGTGTVAAGQPLVLEERPHPEWPIARVNDVRYGRDEDPAQIAALAGCEALAGGWRDRFRRWAQDADEENETPRLVGKNAFDG